MNDTYPCINVCDIETSIQWYEDFLGFQCTYKSSIKHPDCALIEKDELKIYMLKSEMHESYASNIIVIESHDLKADYSVLEKAGAIIIQPIGKGVFSDMQFIIKDYEDNKIVYKQKNITKRSKMTAQ